MTDPREATTPRQSDAAPVLPLESPFFGVETGEQAAKRLRGLFKLDDRAFNDRVMLVQKRKEALRAPLAVGAALLAPGGPATLAGWNLECVVPIDSLAKLAVLYALYQLHSDVAAIGASIGVSSSPDPVAAFEGAVVAAFTRANDPALQAIAKTPSSMPRLRRLFDLKPFVGLAVTRRAQSTLAFNTRSEQGQQESTPDQWQTATRVWEMLHTSSNSATASLIADIGLPYIAALMERSGLAFLAERKGGLWLASAYGPWPPRSSPEPQPIVGAPAGVNATCGPNKGKLITQAGSVLGISTFLLLLQRKQLVNVWASERMQAGMAGGAMLGDGLKDHTNDEKNKVGINDSYTRFAEAAFLNTTPAPPKGASTRDQTESMVALDVRRPMTGSADSRHSETLAILRELGAELEAELLSLRLRVSP